MVGPSQNKILTQVSRIRDRVVAMAGPYLRNFVRANNSIDTTDKAMAR